MSFFVRFTTDAKIDLERGQSFHSTDFKEGEISKEKLSEMMNCDEDDIEVINGHYVQLLEGLCGFELEAETLEEAIEEVEEALEEPRSPFHQYSQIGGIAIFKGELTDSDVPDGDNFRPISIEKIF